APMPPVTERMPRTETSFNASRKSSSRASIGAVRCSLHSQACRPKETLSPSDCTWAWAKATSVSVRFEDCRTPPMERESARTQIVAQQFLAFHAFRRQIVQTLPEIEMFPRRSTFPSLRPSLRIHCCEFIVANSFAYFVTAASIVTSGLQKREVLF